MGEWSAARAYVPGQQVSFCDILWRNIRGCSEEPPMLHSKSAWMLVATDFAKMQLALNSCSLEARPAPEQAGRTAAHLDCEEGEVTTDGFVVMHQPPTQEPIATLSTECERLSSDIAAVRQAAYPDHGSQVAEVVRFDQASSNTAVGKQAHGQNYLRAQLSKGLIAPSAANCTAVGLLALYSNTGNNNTAVGAMALPNNTSGTANTAVGELAGGTNVSGISNTLLGAAADVFSASLTNATAVGAGASVKTSNTIQLGNNAVTTVNTNGSVTCAGLWLPTIAAGSPAPTPALLNYYEELSWSTRFTGCGIPTTSPIPFLLRRVGKVVTVTMQGNFLNTSTTAGNLTNSSALPAQFCPTTTNVIAFVCVFNPTSTLGNIVVNTNGLFNIGAGTQVPAAFPSGSTVGVQPFTLSWCI
jgi:hypothetical protein